MTSRNIADFCKNAMGTVFLLAGAFFVCSTLVSIRAVFADPIAPVASIVTTSTSPRANATNSRRVSSSTVSRRTTTNAATTANANAARAVASRANTGRTNTAATSASTSRGVVARTTTNASRATTANTARSVRSRTATTNNARVSLQGSAIRGNKSTTSYTYLSNKLYTGNYSNIIDSTTGLISSDAYSNCLESYYTCMDEICTARNESQGRCSCAARAKSFNQAETALETANEELIKVSGELALLIANKGKDVSDAFQLTDAEKVMNCVSWQEMSQKYKVKKTDDDGNDLAEKWCQNHSIYDTSQCNATKSPSYCSTGNGGNNFGFNISDIDGSSSDILASLQAWADAKDDAAKMLVKNEKNLLEQYTGVSDLVSGMYTVTDTTSSDSKTLDNLANTWGYELFEYAHNNVCSRVLDSCFNGIYEACGTPPSGGRCANSATTSCPYNYNSRVTVSSAGDVTLNERGTTGTTSSSATCFGYTSTSGDPYSSLRGPVADARRSVMQKYLLDANAACDTYGEQLRKTAQNISYQKTAAQQALQQKRLEFANEEITTLATNYRSAISNFNECLSELFDCYTTQATSNSSWSTSRIKTYCAQVANVPHCYEEMICGAPNNKLQAVISNDAGDKTACANTDEYATNTCRNIITMSEILSDSYASGAVIGSATQLREQCLQNIGIQGVRSWTKTDSGDEWDDSSREVSCNVVHATNAVRTWNASTKSYGDCLVQACASGYQVANDKKSCVAIKEQCAIANATSAARVWNAGTGTYGDCLVDSCASGYQTSDDAKSCILTEATCSVAHAVKATQTWNPITKSYGDCLVQSCQSEYEVSADGKSCEKK